MGKTRDLFKKIRDIKGIFHTNMGSIKDRNGMGLTEAEDIKKRWQEYTEELYKKDLHNPDNQQFYSFVCKKNEENKRNKSICPPKRLHINLHRSIMANSQKVEPADMFISG